MELMQRSNYPHFMQTERLLWRQREAVTETHGTYMRLSSGWSQLSQKEMLLQSFMFHWFDRNESSSLEGITLE
jgi:hypothetical protein